PNEYPFPIRLVDLHQETRWQTATIRLADGTPYVAHIPRTVLEVGCALSLAVAKTHDVCITTLAYKNMVMGTLRRHDRVKMHGFPTHATAACRARRSASTPTSSVWPATSRPTSASSTAPWGFRGTVPAAQTPSRSGSPWRAPTSSPPTL
ncbi:MAG: DUF362 domain-containing protein, partial [Chloroflexi bacterium]|nr:DUF362 domain-containing protein [Chloroflexota bacterium]